MKTRRSAATLNASDELVLSQIDDCLFEIAEIRRQMGETNQEIKRLEISTRQKLVEIRNNLHA